MLIVMKKQATAEEVRAVCDYIEGLGFRAHPMPGALRTAVGVTGNQGAIGQDTLEELPGVAEVIRVTKPYKLVSRDVKEEDTVIHFPGTNASIGGKNLAIMAGPCAIETREQAFAVAEQVAAAGAQFFRGGAYKPRTSPYAFQGLGEEALKIMAEIRESIRHAHCVGGHRSRVAGTHRGVCRHHPNWRAQYAELFPAARSRTHPQAGAVEARHVGDAGRIADGCRIHYERRQLSGDFVRARRTYLCRSHPQHARPEYRSSSAALEPLAHHCRSQPRHRETQQGGSVGHGLQSLSVPTAW